MDPTKNNGTEIAPSSTPSSDIPSFMAGIVTPSEERQQAQDILSTPENLDNPENPTPENPTPENPENPTPKNPENPTPENPENPTPKNPENPTPENPTPEKPNPENPENPENPPQKTAEEIEKEKLESINKAIDRTTQNKELNEHVLNMVSKPLVKIEVPNPDAYKDKEGSFDIQTYLHDTLTKVIVELQRSMAGGSLGAIQFGILKRSIQEESEERVSAIKADEAAKSIWDKLTTKFPILKKDDVADRFERAVYGEKYRRSAKAKAENKQYVDLNYADYEKLAADIIGGNPSPAPGQKDPVEIIPGTPQLNGGSNKGKDPVGDDIDAMMAVKKKSGVIF